MIFKTSTVVFVFFLMFTHAFSNVCSTIKDGSWHDASTWHGGILPETQTDSIEVKHHVTISNPETVTCVFIAIHGTLVIGERATLDFVSGGIEAIRLDILATGRLVVNGQLMGREGTVWNNTTPANTFFASTAFYIHEMGPRGVIPFATWDEASTLKITGFKNSGYIAIAYSESWKQSFGNVIFDCAGQTSFVDLNGYLSTIRGDFVIANTNGNALRLATTQRAVINIDKDFVVRGNSEVWFGTLSDSVVVNVKGNFEYASSSTGLSYFTTRGKCWVSVGKQMIFNSAGHIRLCSSGGESVPIRRTIINLHNGLYVFKNSIIAPAPGRGAIVFAGDQEQELLCHANSFDGVIDVVVEASAVVNVKESVVASSGNLHVKGTLSVGSNDVDGAVQLQQKGNIRIRGARNYYAGATIVYRSNQQQFIGEGHPTSNFVNLKIDNASGVTLRNSLEIKNLEIASGVLDAFNQSMSITGNINVSKESKLALNNGQLKLTGALAQRLQTNNARVSEMVIAKDEGHVYLDDSLTISKLVHIQSPTILYTKDNLVLTSSSVRQSDTGSIGPLPIGAAIEGDVTIARYMPPKRAYRYISSPIKNASVRSLMDDFPVTGVFDDPSAGRGINSKAPSLFYYDENNLEVLDGWKPFPTRGKAADNYLEVGLGYAAFIREGSRSTIWDVTGELNQGSIAIPLQYSPSGSTQVRGWNLIGNPYACAIDWDVIEGWEKSDGISTTIAVRDNSEDRFRYWDGAIGDLEGGLIASGQSFWVRTTAPSSLTIHEQAKALHDASFYRQNQHVDYIKLSIAHETVSDNAYIRLHPHASMGVDKYDAVKMQNQTLNFSTLSAEENIALAINAMPAFNCYQEIPLVFELLTNPSEISSSQGLYQFTITTSGLAASSEVAVLDRYIDSLYTQPQFTFNITSDAESWRRNRFVLIIKSTPIDSPQLTYAPTVCGDEEVVEINMANYNNAYALRASCNGDVFNATNASLTIPSSLLNAYSHTPVIVQVASLCDVYVDTIYITKIARPSAPKISQVLGCDQRITMNIVNAEQGIRYSWYSSNHDLLQSDTTTSITVKATDRLVVVAHHPLNNTCKSSKVEIQAAKNLGEHEQRLFISYADRRLEANYKSLWFVNEISVNEDSSFHYTPAISGLYKASALVNGCPQEETIDIVVEELFNIYPNPFNAVLKVEAQEEIEELTVYDVTGRVVMRAKPNGKNMALQTLHFASGVFVVDVRTGTKHVKSKVIKKALLD